mgnify:CR=1 FL=1
MSGVHVDFPSWVTTTRTAPDGSHYQVSRVTGEVVNMIRPEPIKPKMEENAKAKTKSDLKLIKDQVDRKTKLYQDFQIRALKEDVLAYRKLDARLDELKSPAAIAKNDDKLKAICLKYAKEVF